jgi:hypothetical protein
VWLIAILAGIVVERGVTTMGQGSVMTTTVAGQGKELATGWLVWQRRAAEGLSLEDVGAVVEPPKAKPEKTPDRQSMTGGREYV